MDTLFGINLILEFNLTHDDNVDILCNIHGYESIAGELRYK